MQSIALVFSLLLLPWNAEAHVESIPVYLLQDWRFWVFLGIYGALTAKCIRWTLTFSNRHGLRNPSTLEAVNSSASVILGIGLFYQILHFIEHLAQIYQYWYLGQYALISRGIIFFLDLEWNHFLFDSIYFLLLLVGTCMFLQYWRAKGRNIDTFGGFLITGTIAVQGWHAVEHTYRIVRHVRIGCDPCRGIADVVFGVHLIPLHFWFNVFALTFPLLLFFYYQMDRKILAYGRKK